MSAVAGVSVGPRGSKVRQSVRSGPRGGVTRSVGTQPLLPGRWLILAVVALAIWWTPDRICSAAAAGRVPTAAVAAAYLPTERKPAGLVSAIFAHQSGKVPALSVTGFTKPIGCTGAHPFWREDRHDFIPARELVPGETLRTESGTLRQITRSAPRRGLPVSVFNLEVDGEQVDYVSVEGVLVNHAYQDAEIVDFPDSGIIRCGNKNRVVSDGMEVRAVRDVSHVSEATLKQIALDRFAAKDINGKSLH